MSAALVVRTMEPHDASAWLNMQLVLWTDADRAEQTEQIASYFSGTNLFITVAFIALLGDSPTGFLELHLRPYAEGYIRRSRTSKVGL